MTACIQADVSSRHHDSKSRGLYGRGNSLEILACFTFWLWLRRGASPASAALGILSLIGFAVALTRVDAAFRGTSLRRLRWHLHRRVSRLVVAR